MRHVVFIAPFPAETTLRFLRALSMLEGVRLSGIVHTMPTGEDANLFADVARVEEPLDIRHLRAALGRLVERNGHPHRIVGLLEPLQVAIAKLREELGVEGTSVATAELFRDKAKMKDALRAHGLPCARHRIVRAPEDAVAFAEEVGLPIVIKPPAGMGCKATWRIASMDQLGAAMAAIRPSADNVTLAEEMIRGREHSHETITVGGRVQLSSITDYYPTPLEVMENPWIQWMIIAPRDVQGPAHDEVHALGQKTVEALGLDRGMTHMEWFERDEPASDGSRLAIGEIAARPPGANIVRMTGLAYDTSMYRAWARALVDDAFDGPWERKYATGCAFLRGAGSGRVAAVDGAARTQEAVGELIAEAKLPSIGAPKSDSYEGDGYVLVRHPDTEVVRSALQTVIDNIRVYYA
jgi:formate-dependent phosphoribosylglycinamide formyltransferase (GAR transformylase)